MTQLIRLPEELWVEVFKRSPADTKLRVPLVCKTFCSMTRKLQLVLELNMSTTKLAARMHEYPNVREIRVFMCLDEIADFVTWVHLQSNLMQNDIRLQLCVPTPVQPKIPVRFCLGKLWAAICTTPFARKIAVVSVDVETSLCLKHVESYMIIPLSTVLTSRVVFHRRRYKYTRSIDELTIRDYNSMSNDMSLTLPQLVKAGGFTGLVHLSLTGSVSNPPLLDALLSCPLSALQSLTLTHFAQSEDTDTLYFRRLPSLLKLVLISCEIMCVEWDTLARLQHLQLRRCTCLTGIELRDMPGLESLIVDGGVRDDDPVWLSAAPKDSKLAVVSVRNVDLVPALIRTWTALRTFEVVDCMYDGTMMEIAQAAMEACPDVRVVMAYTEGDELADEEVASFWYNIIQLSSRASDSIQRNGVELCPVYGSAAFDDVKGVLMYRVA